MLLIAVAALIATVGKDTKEGLHWQMLVPLASVAFQSSGQAACIGGLYAHSSVGLAGALWTACGLKLLAVFAWVFWPSEILEE